MNYSTFNLILPIFIPNISCSFRVLSILIDVEPSGVRLRNEIEIRKWVNKFIASKDLFI